MNNQEILNKAPKKTKGILIFDGFYRWLREDDTYSKLFVCKGFDDMVEIQRSLADIERIVELEKEIGSIQESYNAAIETCKDLYFQIEKYEHSIVGSNLNNIKADAIESVADKFNSIFVNEKVTSSIPPEQFIWWNRVYVELKGESNKLRKGDL